MSCYVTITKSSIKKYASVIKMGYAYPENKISVVYEVTVLCIIYKPNSLKKLNEWDFKVYMWWKGLYTFIGGPAFYGM